MPLVPVPKPTFTQKLKRFFMIDLIKGMGLTLGFNIGALTDRDSVAGKGIYTEQYPKVRPDVAPRFHGAPRLNMDPETHDTLCIACNLCALTYSTLGMRKDWKRFLKTLKRPLEFLHADELKSHYGISGLPLPAIFKKEDDRLELLIDADSINKCLTIDHLKQLIKDNLS